MTGPTNHEQDRNVPRLCKTDTRPGFVYFVSLEMPDGEFLKVGFATDAMQRVHTLQTSLPVDLEIELILPGTKEQEKEIHALLAEHRERREWFRLEHPVQEFLDDLRDAKLLLQMTHGMDYDPSYFQCRNLTGDRLTQVPCDAFMKYALDKSPPL